MRNQLPLGTGLSRDQKHEDIASLYEALRQAIRDAGGYDVLIAGMDKRPSYITKLSEAISRTGQRRAHIDWLASLLRHPKAAPVLLERFCALAGYEMPKPLRTLQPDELLESLVSVLKGSGKVGEAAINEAARKLGTDPIVFKRGR